MKKLSEGTFVGYYGKENKWKVYRVSDGTLVAYTSKRDADDNALGKDHERVVTNARDMVGLSMYLDKRRKKRSKHKKPIQLRIE